MNDLFFHEQILDLLRNSLHVVDRPRVLKLPRDHDLSVGGVPPVCHQVLVGLEHPSVLLFQALALFCVLLLQVQQIRGGASLVHELLEFVDGIVAIRTSDTLVDLLDGVDIVLFVSILLFLEDGWHPAVHLFGPLAVQRTALVESVTFVELEELCLSRVSSRYDELGYQ